MNLSIKEIKQKLASGDLVLYEKKLYTRDEWKQIEDAKKQEDLYDLFQLTKKIQLNSTYGALLNQFFRFGRIEMGASVTATGRQITTHMIETIGEVLTGERKELMKIVVPSGQAPIALINGKVIKPDERQSALISAALSGRGKNNKDEGDWNFYVSQSPATIYSDTDSCYYQTFGNNIEEAVEIADAAAEAVNDSFPAFMSSAFNCQPGFDTLIKAGREVVASRGIFQAKKKYLLKVVDMEGFRTTKIKSQGSEIKKSDTPKIIQSFIEGVVDSILDGASYKELMDMVNSARNELISPENTIKLGVAKAVNNLDKFYREWVQFEKSGAGKVNLPGHVRASINYNEHVKLREGAAGKQIKSGDKILVFQLKNNQYGYKSIAIPAESTKLPDWMQQDFEVDLSSTEDKLIDSKLKGIFSALGWEVPTFQKQLFDSIFEDY